MSTDSVGLRYFSGMWPLALHSCCEASGQTWRQRGKCNGGCWERKAAGETIGSQRGGPFQRTCGGRRLHYLQFEQKQGEEWKVQRLKRETIAASVFHQRRWLVILSTSLFHFTVVNNFSYQKRGFVSVPPENVSWLFWLIWSFSDLTPRQLR